MKNDGAGAGEPGPVDFPWQHYVAMHSQAGFSYANASTDHQTDHASAREPCEKLRV